MIYTENQIVILILKKKPEKRFQVRLEKDKEFHTHKGVIKFNDIIGREGAIEVESSLGDKFIVLYPRIDDMIFKTSRNTQIIYPKDIGIILIRADIMPGKTVIEAGAGSGALTAIIGMYVGDTGKVITFERREEFSKKIISNINRFDNLYDKGRIELIIRDVYEEGFEPYKADSLILDLPEPWQCAKYFSKALNPGGCFVSLLPTVSQVARLLDDMRESFIDIIVEEIMIRKWKTGAHTLRPFDRMIGHTGFLISGRFIGSS